MAEVISLFPIASNFFRLHFTAFRLKHLQNIVASVKPLIYHPYPTFLTRHQQPYEGGIILLLFESDSQLDQFDSK